MTHSDLAAWCQEHGCRHEISESAPGSIDLIFPLGATLPQLNAVVELQARLSIATVITLRSEVH